MIFERAADTAQFWDARYKSKRGAGPGSMGKLYAFKLETVQAVVKEHNIKSVIDYGCGDGRQLAALEVDVYTGLDISAVGIKKARKNFTAHRRRYKVLPVEFDLHRAEMVVSLDVVMHLPDDEYEPYMRTMFGVADRFVLIYAPNIEPPKGIVKGHMFFRRFTTWIKDNTDARLIRHIANPYPATATANAFTSYSEFFLYEI